MPLSPFDFNPLNPQAQLQPFQRAEESNPFMPRRQEVQPLSPEEEESLLGKIGSGALGGLGYVGSVLEKTFGGRAVRGILGGKPRELLSVLPFSDTLGITDENDRVSGQELLGFDKDDHDWGALLPGMAAEIALDPGTYLTFGAGALTGAGKVAAKAGVLPKTVRGRMTQTLADALAHATPEVRLAAQNAAGGAPELASLGGGAMGGLFGFGLPFGGPRAVVGAGMHGAHALDAAGAALKAADSTLRNVPLLGGMYSFPVDTAAKAWDVGSRYTRAFLDPTVMGATTRAGQEVGEQAHALVRPVMAEGKTAVAGWADRLHAAGVDPQGDVLRRMMEGVPLPGGAAAHPELQAVQTEVQGFLARRLERMQELGVNVNELADPTIRYGPRYHAPLARPTRGHGGSPMRALATEDARLAGREPILEGIPGGTERINELLMDPAVYNMNDLAAIHHIRTNYLGAPVSAAPDKEATRQAKKLLDWARGLDPQYRSAAEGMAGGGQPLRFFGNHPLADVETYNDRVARLLGATEATQGLLGRSLVDASTLGGTVPPGMLRADEALAKLGLTMDTVNASGARVGAAPTLWDRYRRHVMEVMGQPDPGATPSLLSKYVPAEAMEEATRYLGSFKTPEYANKALAGADYLTNLTKAFQTAPNIAFHVRNLFSGMFQNMLGGASLTGEGGLLRNARDAHRLVRGGEVEGASAIKGLSGLTDAQATQSLAREMYAQGVGGYLPHVSREAVGPSGDVVSMGTGLSELRQRIPGVRPIGPDTALGKVLPKSLEEANPLNLSGVNTNVDRFAPVVAGRELGDYVEGLNRGSLYLSLRRQGWSEVEAGKKVLAAHFDYTRAGATNFESEVMRRLVPFYRYTRSNIPFQARELATNPGGLAGMTAKVAEDLHQNAGFLPDYLGSGLAVPTGAEDERGVRRYLTRIDTPPEQAFEWLKGGPRGNQNTLLGLLGMTNPLLKAPVEWATGKQFFSGRDLEDLYSLTGNSGLDQVLMNSPLSRQMTAVRTLADERKWQDPYAIPLNLLTGAKVTDVDMPQQRLIAEREYVQDILQRLPEIGKFERLAVRPGAMATLGPDELQLLRLNRTLESRAKAEAQRRRVEVR